MLNFLTKTVAPWVIAIDDYDATFQFLKNWSEKSEKNCFYVLNGEKMRTMSLFNDEVYRAFKFPAYYGRNANSLVDCLTDESILDGDFFAVFVRDASLVLECESFENQTVFLDTMNLVANLWSTPVCENKEWDREAKPFHVFLNK